MCGIAGFSLSRTDNLPRLSQIADALLLQIESRGQDSTGMAWSTTGRKMYLSKDPIPARSFVRTKRTRMINRTEAVNAVLHTRFATQGTKAKNVNNHPILHGDVIGVHNGHLNNDDEIFRGLGAKRNGEVDSEAAFALLDSRPDDVDVPTMLGELRGRAALAWLDKRERGSTLHLARVKDSPLALGQTRGGSLFFASTMTLLENAMAAADVELDWKFNVDEGTYIKVRRGKIVSFDSFTPPPVYTWAPSRTTSNVVPLKRTRLASDYPSRWTDYDGQWLDDDTFIPFSD